MSTGENLKALRRRAAYLRKRIADSTEKKLTFDIMELTALEWALEILTPKKTLPVRAPADLALDHDRQCDPKEDAVSRYRIPEPKRMPRSFNC